MTFLEYLKKIDACEDAVKWITDNNLTPQQTWDTCPRGDWLLWWAEKEKADRRKLVLCGGLCAQTVEHLMTDQRSKDGVKAAIDYGNGLIDDEQLRAAARAARAASWAASAARAASYAARAAGDAARAASYAARAAGDAARAAGDAAGATNQKQTADIVRSIITPTWIETILN